MRRVRMEEAPVTARQFSCFRFLFGVYLAWHYFALMPFAEELFSPAGILGAHGANPFEGRLWNPLFSLEDTRYAIAFPALAGVLSLLLAYGLGRRPAAVVTAILHAMLFTACPLISNPGLPYVGVLLWLCAIIPHGEAGRAGIQWTMPSCALFTGGFLLAAGYTFSGVSKLHSPGWLDGSALRTVLETPLARDNVLTTAMLSLPDSFLGCITLCVLAFEIAYLPLWLVPRLRTALWVAAMAFHAGILLTLDFADLTLGMVMIQLFVMPAWIWQWGARLTVRGALRRARLRRSRAGSA